MEQGSYMLLSPGMAVRGTNNENLGSILDVAADETVDIFRGIVVSPPGIFARSGVFVPADHIISVVGDVATVDLTLEQLSQMEPVAGVAARS